MQPRADPRLRLVLPNLKHADGRLDLFGLVLRDIRGLNVMPGFTECRRGGRFDIRTVSPRSILLRRLTLARLT
jgi:hypothetical protein